MAVVGDAYIMVRAITKNVRGDIVKGLNSVNGDAAALGRKAGNAYGSELSKRINKSASEASKAFHKLVRSSYYLQSGLTAAAGSLSALVGGLTAFVGVAAGAATAGVALVGSMVQLKVASLVGKQAFSGISQAVSAAGKVNKSTTKTVRDLREEMQQLAFAAEEAALNEQEAALNLEKAREELAMVQSLPPDNRARREAELAYAQADLAYRKAKDRNKDAQKELQKGPKKDTGGGGAADPFANLTKSQKKFAQYLVSVKPKMKELKEAAAGGFLPVLQTQMERFFAGGGFDMLVKGFSNVSKGLGEASRVLGNSIMSPQIMKDLSNLFASTGRNAGAFGKILGNALKAFVTLMSIADPLINRFVNFLNLKSFKMFENLRNNAGGVGAFFKQAGDAAAGFGRIFGNLWAGFKAIISANIGPGSGGRMLLDWIGDATQSFRNLGGALEQESMFAYFAAAAENFKAMSQALGGFFRVFAGLGTDPNIKIFWDTLAGGTGFFEKLASAASGAMPLLAELVVKVLDIMTMFIETGQIEAYFSALIAIVRILEPIAAGLAGLMSMFSKLVGTVGAFITAFLVIKKVGLIIWGTVIPAIKAWKAIQLTMIGINSVQIAQEVAKKKGLVALTAAQIKDTIATRISSATRAINVAALNGSTAAAIKNKVVVDQGTISWVAYWIAATGGVALLALAIAGITAGLVLWAAAADKANFEESVKKTTAALQEQITVTNQATRAQKLWNGAKDASYISAESELANVRNLGAALAKQTREQEIANELAAKTAESNDIVLQFIGTASKEMADSSSTAANLSRSFESLGKSLADMAKKDMKKAQDGFIAFANTSGMSRKQLNNMLHDMPEFEKALDAQAKKLGLISDATDYATKKRIRLDIATRSGTYDTLMAQKAQERLTKAIKDGAASFIDLQGPLQQSKEDIKGYTDAVSVVGGEKFSLEKYLADINKQLKAQDEWLSNLNILKNKGISDSLYKKLAGMGKEGAGLVAALTRKSKEEIEKIGAQVISTGADATSGIAAALTDPNNIIKAYKNKNKGAGSFLSSTVQELQRMVKAGTYSIKDIMAKAGITNDDLTKYLDSDASAMNQDVVWKEGALDKMATQLKNKLGGKKVTVDLAVGEADGGLIGNLRSSFKGFAGGGRVFGPGGPRSDVIPAMLSNGEYVINAAATARNRQLLDAINYGNFRSDRQPLNSSSANITMNIYPSQGMDEVELGKIITRRLNYELRRGALS